MVVDSLGPTSDRGLTFQLVVSREDSRDGSSGGLPKLKFCGEFKWQTHPEVLVHGPFSDESLIEEEGVTVRHHDRSLFTAKGILKVGTMADARWATMTANKGRTHLVRGHCGMT